MHLVVFFCAVISAAIAGVHNPHVSAWNEFKIAHNKIYDSQEDGLRFQIFSDNLNKIEEHNALYSVGLKTYKQGVNKFADWTHEEFKNYLTLSGNKPAIENFLGLHETSASTQLPESIDYRTKGAVNPIKDQMDCGSCWAFSAVGSLESINYLENEKLLSLSEQNLVDCSGKYGNYGCRGGLMESAFDYIVANGLETEDAYPYHALDQVCQFNKSKSVITIHGYKGIKAGSEDDLHSAVGTIGPISVAVDASNFQFYKSGIYKEDNDDHILNHGVVAIGYGSENGQDFWLVRNSWGVNWGEDGYIRIARNAKNQVGIADDACYPVVYS